MCFKFQARERRVSSLQASVMNSPPVTPGAGAGVPAPSTAAVEADDEPEHMFIDEVPDYLKCAICLCVLKNPYQVVGKHAYSEILKTVQ